MERQATTGQQQTVVRQGARVSPIQPTQRTVLAAAAIGIVAIPAALLIGLTQNRKARINRLERRLAALRQKKQTFARKAKIARLEVRLKQIQAKLAERKVISDAHVAAKAGRPLTAVQSETVRRKLALRGRMPMRQVPSPAEVEEAITITDSEVDGESAAAEVETVEESPDDVGPAADVAPAAGEEFVPSDASAGGAASASGLFGSNRLVIGAALAGLAIGAVLWMRRG